MLEDGVAPAEGVERAGCAVAPRQGAPRAVAEPMDVLFVSYYFPPLGGAGVQRAAKFVRHLPAEGIRPIVVGGPVEGRNDWSPEDESLAADVPASVPVYRPDPPPAGLPHYSTASRLLLRPAPYYRWWARAMRSAALRAAERHAPRLVYVSLSPFDGLEPALEVGRELGLPVVADLRDPWALDEVQVYPSLLHRAGALRRMGRLLRGAEAVVMNTPDARRAAEEAFPDLRDRLTVLTNGYDAEDFAGLAPRAPDGRFRIVHSGYLHTSRAAGHARRGRLQRLLGGERARVDFYGRSHVYLLRALEQIAREDPDRAATVELHLIGVATELDRRVADSSPIAPRVRFLGYRSHAETVRALVESDLLFLPLHGLPDGTRARIVPGKTYEYLASGRPILAAVPEGDARDFVLEAGAGRVVAPGDVGGLAAALRAFLAEAPAPMRAPGPEVTRFERRELARRLAELFRRVVQCSR